MGDMKIPVPVPEIPVSSIDSALSYYVHQLGFTVDWQDGENGIAGISRDDCRLFLTDTAFRATEANAAPVVLWLNVENRTEVDEVFSDWQAAGAHVVSEPEDKPWNLREFKVADSDGNVLRVFYDFSLEI
jgi:uncharacterized glyoxalase superfamily protein PhnB